MDKLSEATRKNPKGVLTNNKRGLLILPNKQCLLSSTRTHTDLVRGVTATMDAEAVLRQTEEFESMASNIAFDGVTKIDTRRDGTEAAGERPKYLDDVTVRLDDGEAFRFRLGSKTAASRGLQLAICMMCKGESSQFRLQPKLYTLPEPSSGYARRGAWAEDVPAETDEITVMVELLGFSAPIDVSGDGGVLKYIIKTGDGEKVSAMNAK